MSRILKVREPRTELYTYDISNVDEIRLGKDGNILVLDGNRVGACCLNCANPRCIIIKGEAIQCTKFNEIAGSIDMHICPSNAISVGDKSVQINESMCSGCGLCVRACPTAAITIKYGKARVNVYSGEQYIKRLPVTNEAIEEQERFLIKCEKIKKQGIILYESDGIMKHIQKYVHFINQDKQNIFVRNLLILLGNHATVTRKGNVYMRLDGFYQNQNGYGVFEVETGNEVLDMSRAILDDIAVLNSRYGIARECNKPLAVCLNLPNKRTDYWQVVRDIKDVTGIKILTVTIGALLIMLWNNVELQDFTQFYIDIDNTSIRSKVERLIGREIQLSMGTCGILENMK